jgi:WD40 repeat protein
VVPTETPTPYPGGSIITLSPNSDKVGWVASDESRANHLGDSYLYAGIFDGVLYHSILQFDLSGVPRGARIHAAVLELGGLDNRRLGNSGVWEVRILSREMDENWDRLTFQDVHNAPIQWTVQPAIGASDLYVGRSNAFAFAGELLRDLELRLLEEHYAVSFRIDGPFAGENSIFAWDSGHGPASNGRLPVLLLNVGPPPLTPLPSGTPPFVVVTSTPTPANVLTAAAYVRTATAVARTTGQPTPTSIYEWTATPEHVVTSTPVPANQATAEHNDAVATAIALTTGTFTPAPVEQVTATPTPAWIAEGELTPTPLPPATPSLPEALRERILFESNRAGGAGPWVMDADGYNVSLLTASWPYDVAMSREALSPDGTRLVYAGEWQGRSAILVRTWESREGRAVVVLEEGQVSYPVWSPTRSQIAFVATVDRSAQIWLVNVDGSGLRQVTPSEGGSAYHPSFSPDGNRLVYWSAGAQSLRQVWTISLDGTGRANISNNVYDEWNPVWVK